MTLRRSALSRRTPLQRTGASLRRTPLRTRPRPRLTPQETAGQAEWSNVGAGECENCRAWVPSLEPHHIIPKQLLKREGRRDLLFDLRNRFLICSCCHRHHTDHFRLIPVSRIPDDALAWAVDFFGDDVRAAAWFGRYYGTTA